MKMIAILLLLAVAGGSTLAEPGTVVKWENKSYSQSAHIIRNQVVYSVRVKDTTYQIAKRSDKVEFMVGQQIECRVNKDHLFVANDNGKESKYDIVGVN